MTIDHALDWSIWARMLSLRPTEAVALTYGAEPRLVFEWTRGTWVTRWHGDRFGAVYELGGFANRLELLRRTHGRAITPTALARWALTVGWNIPQALADLAPEIGTPAVNPTPPEIVDEALAGVLAHGASIDALRRELERLGVRFYRDAGKDVVNTKDGTVRGKTAPLAYLWASLSSIAGQGELLETLIRGSGASGSGALQSPARWHPELTHEAVVPLGATAHLEPDSHNDKIATPPRTSASWSVRAPQRWDTLTRILADELDRADKFLAPPSARELIDRWQASPPLDLQVRGGTVEFNRENGVLAVADIRAVQARIARMAHWQRTSASRQRHASTPASRQTRQG